jgi:hypothetical protein
MTRRPSIGLLLAALLITFVPSVAFADVNEECFGEAKIKGETYTPANDTPGNAIPIPNEKGVQVTYSGGVTFENKNHKGSVKVQVGPFPIEVGDWEGSNEADVRSVENNIYELDDFRNKLPIWIPGVWRVSGTHSASGGSCDGFAMIKLEGAALGSAVGWIALIGLIGAGYGAIGAAMKRQTVFATLAAFVAGIFLAILLMMFGVRPLDTLTTVVLPVVLGVVALIVSLTRPRSVF